MKKGNRLVALGLVVAMAVSVLTGCGTKSKKSNEAYEYDPNKEVELSGTFELQIFTGGYGSKAWEEIIAAFEEEYPELDVVAYMDSNVNKQMQSRWMEGDPVDFVFLSGSNLPSQTYMDSGKLLDLTSFYENATIHGTDELLKDHLTSDYVTKYKDHLYDLPVVLTSYGMWYNEAYLNELGMKLPTNYDELLAFGQEAKAKGVDALIYPGMSANYLTNGLLFPAIAVYGQEYFNRITSASDVEAFKDERLRDVLTRFKGLIDAGMFSDGTVSLNAVQAQIQWLSNEALLIPNGLWLENEMKDDIPNDFVMRYAVPMMNKADEGQVVVTSSAKVGVAAEGDNKDAALEFLRFLYKEENITKFAEYAKVPVATDADVSKIELTDAAKHVQEVLHNPDYTNVNLELSWGSVDAVVIDMVNQMVLGKLDVDGAIDMLVEAVEAKLAEE